jgi:tetratricopeptide (TPR) repeat protein
LFFKYGFLWIVPNVQWMSIDLRPVFPLSLGDFPQVLGLPLYLALLAVSVWLMWRFADWRRYVGFALFTPAVLFATEFATVWIQDPFVLYRSYLWAIGLPLLFALPFVGAKPKTVLGVGLVIAVCFCALAFERVDSLKTEFSAWDDAARKIDLEAPANAVGRFRPFINRGNQLFMQERFTLAASDYGTAIKLGDYDGTAEYHLGSLLQLTGKHEQALAAFERVEAKGGMAHSPELLSIQQAQLLARLQRHAEALVQADKALGFKQLDEEGRLRMLDIRARSNLQLGHADVAFHDYEAMIALDPENEVHRINQAMSLAYAGRHQEALDALVAIAAGAKESELRTARAIVLNMMGQRVAAINEARAALAAKPDNPAPRALLRQLGVE